ncbi:YceD family protein [Fontimonas sp. SYSU GA230001]|uniref:YceD family protein n=1 Tax=Fontimonas sp. SYSU GA230001 TaxID=3142450 RepID=UPI0032B564D0
MSIPREVQASVAVAQEQRFQGELTIRSCERLREAVIADAAAALQVDIRADARSGWPRVHGRVSGRVDLECRRCGQRFAHPLDLALDLRLVRDEAEERAVLADAEPYCAVDDRLPVRELIEEEVLLALPMLPRCESCENDIANAPSAPQESSEEKPENPFAVLKRTLKTHQ